jgi:hypothetical protein
MGLLVLAEGGRASDVRLRRALPPLAGFGLVHAAHEWMEMYVLMGHPATPLEVSIMSAMQLATLAFSFISLAAFGSFLLADNEITRRLILLIPIGLQAVWVFGLYHFRGVYVGQVLWDVADTWTRYTLAIPASLLTAIGLVAQQRAFRRSGLIRFGRDALWAAITFGWYGLFGQFFGELPLFLSNIINQQTFFDCWFSHPDVPRCNSSCCGSLYPVLRFQVKRNVIADLQARGGESQQREIMRWGAGRGRRPNASELPRPA